MKTLIIAICLLCATVAGAANYTLEIIQPQPDLTTINRFYKAYPGLLYEVNVAVIGGDYPFTYALTTAPSGMTINSSTGQISWSNPTASGSPHTVAVQVTDATAHTDTVTWTVTVTTTGFIFVNSTAGDGGDGTISSPFNTILDFYVSKANATYKDYFVYFRAGTYNFTGVDMTDGNFNVSYHPAVYLAYPGETATIDFSTGRMYAEMAADNWYMDGLTLSGQNASASRYQQIRLCSSADNITFRKNTITSLPGASAGSNSSAVMFHEAGIGNYNAFIDNNWMDYNSAYAVLMYSQNKILFADNTLSSVTGTLDIGRGFAAKCGNTNVHVRSNTYIDFGTNTVALDALFAGVTDGCDQNSGALEWSYNNVSSSSGSAISIADASTPVAGGAIYIHHNTLTAPVRANVYHDIGPIYFDANVMQNAASGVTISGSYASNVHIGDTSANLTGTSGLVDSSGLLVNRSYVGTYGWETAASTPTPSGSLRPGVSAAGVTFR